MNVASHSGQLEISTVSEPDIAFFRMRFSGMAEDELADVCAQLKRRPDSMTPVAQKALREVLLERGLNSAELAAAQGAAEIADRQLVRERKEVQAAKSKRRTRALERVLGVIGLGVSAIILIPSIAQSHIGGSVAAAATALCSFWLLFRYKGD